MSGGGAKYEVSPVPQMRIFVTSYTPFTEPLPPPKEVVNGNIKTVTEYREEEDGRKVKVSGEQD